MENVTLENWQEYLEECPDLHDRDCCLLFNECDADIGILECCSNAKFLKNFILKIIEERDKYWVIMLKEHQKHCTSQGRKELTKVKNKMWGKFQFPKN